MKSEMQILRFYLVGQIWDSNIDLLWVRVGDPPKHNLKIVESSRLSKVLHIFEYSQTIRSRRPMATSETILCFRSIYTICVFTQEYVGKHGFSLNKHG